MVTPRAPEPVTPAEAQLNMFVKDLQAMLQENLLRDYTLLSILHNGRSLQSASALRTCMDGRKPRLDVVAQELAVLLDMLHISTTQRRPPPKLNRRRCLAAPRPGSIVGGASSFSCPSPSPSPAPSPCVLLLFLGIASL